MLIHLFVFRTMELEGASSPSSGNCVHRLLFPQLIPKFTTSNPHMHLLDIIPETP